MGGSFEMSGFVGLKSRNGNGGSAFFSASARLHNATTFAENEDPKTGAVESDLVPA